MNVGELKQQLSGMPDDAIVVVNAQFGDDKFEINSLEFEENEDYFDIDDEPKKGNIVIL